MKTAGLHISTVCYVHYLLVTIYMYIYFIYIACEDSWSTYLHSVLRTLPAGYYIYIYVLLFEDSWFYRDDVT